jgi:hypothetical protein
MAAWGRWWWGLGSALLLLAALAGAASSAWAQGRPRIDGFDVERVPELAAGTRLNFSVFGSPGGQVVLQIDGARRPLPLREVQPGVYDGSYLLEAGEHIAADARVVATLRTGGFETRAMLDEPLLLGQAAVTPRPLETQPTPALPPVATSVPDPGPVTAPVPATEPTPAPPPAPSRVPMPTRPAPDPTTDPTAERPASPGPAPDFPSASPRRGPAPCPDCATVESIRPLPPDTRPPASAPGVLLGGLFGERVGQAVDRHVARVSGAVGRAVHGRPLDERSGPGVEVVLRLPNGQRLLRVYDREPDLRVGDTVRRSNDLGGARSERLLDAPAPPSHGPRLRTEQLAGSLPP